MLAGLCHADTPVSKIESQLTFVQGDIDLLDGQATLFVGPRYEYLDRTDAVRVLEAVGQPASGDVIGMLIPVDASPFDTDSWFATIRFLEEGFVDPALANTLSPDALLLEARKTLALKNQGERVQNEPTTEYLGWGLQPQLEPSSNTVYWSKVSRTVGQDAQTRYTVLTLGRSGFVQINIQASVEQQSMIDREIPTLSKVLEFSEGNRSQDFTQGDAVADYTLTSLITGGDPEPATLLASVQSTLASSWNQIAILVLLVAVVMLLLRTRKQPVKRRTPGIKNKKIRT